jgi:anti-repressor protein
MNEPCVVFSNKELGSVRTAVVDDAPFFALVDVCRVLEVGNPRDVAARLREEEQYAASGKPQPVGIADIDAPSIGVIQLETPTSAGTRPITFINEPNLYNVILQSRKPAARKFKRWLVSEVLPTLRKTGSYSLARPKTYLEALKALILEVEQRERLEAEQAQLKAVNTEPAPDLRTVSRTPIAGFLGPDGIQ